MLLGFGLMLGLPVVHVVLYFVVVGGAEVAGTGAMGSGQPGVGAATVLGGLGLWFVVVLAIHIGQIVYAYSATSSVNKRAIGGRRRR